ncbi:MAG TPA: sodium:proton antiporter, partial [Gemmatimonadaceae bacterium]|nr:sodium:proton antiporter [Gemmatimonadaceae bacterium]
MPLSGSIIVLLLVAAAVALVAPRARVPYTVALVVAGLLLAVVPIVHPPPLTKELLFAVFLPGLLFEASVQLEADEFWRNRVVIFSLALPAVVISTVIVAVGLVLLLPLIGLSFGWESAFVFATLIAATDPIAVVALVRTLGAPTRLAVLIEGESLLNDGTAAVSFTTAVAVVLGGQPKVATLAFGFAYAIVIAILLGGAIGMVTRKLLAWIDDAMVLITVTTAAAYGSFLIAETMHASGVIAAVTAGLLSGTEAAKRAIAPESRTVLRAFWDYVAFALNSIVFLLIGFQAGVSTLLSAWPMIVIAFVVVTLTRIAVTYLVVGTVAKAETFPRRWTPVLAWGGLRGSLAMVLALSLPAEMVQRDAIVSMTIGVVVLSILIQGMTVRPLLRRLGLESAEAR